MSESPFLSLWQYFKGKRNQALWATLYSILNKIFDIAPPILIGLAVDTVVKKEDSFLANFGVQDPLQQVYLLGLLTFLIWALESIFEFLFKVAWRNFAQEVQHTLRLDAYDHIQKLPLSFFEKQNSGNLTTVLNDDVNQLERFLNGGVNDIIQVLTTVICIGAIFFSISPMIALLSFTPVPFILWGSFYFQKKIAPRYQKVRNEAGDLSSLLVNNLQGIMTIKASVAQDFEKARLEKLSQRFSLANQKAIIFSSSFSPLIRMVVLSGFLFTLVLGGLYTFEGKIEVGSYSVLIFLVQRLLWPLTRLGETFDLYQRATASLKRILSLLDVPLPQNQGQSSVPFSPNESPSLEFKDVNFHYEPNLPILKKINFKVAPGETIAFVGTTGSGKSTLIKLLLKFYQPQQGQILVNSQDLQSIKTNDLRSQMSFVSQGHHLFFGSVRENILYGSFNKTEEEMIKAAQMAEAHTFIQKLPQGYDTIVGERGQKLSGGEQQRIALARAIIKDPSIYILDEATSAIDNETESSIQQSLLNFTKGKTTLIIAHRLSTVKHAHQIYVLDHGQIVESGKHDELLEKKSVYSNLWSLQKGGTTVRQVNISPHSKEI